MIFVETSIRSRRIAAFNNQARWTTAVVPTRTSMVFALHEVFLTVAIFQRFNREAHFMTDSVWADLLQSNGELPFSIAKPDGDLVFENAAARRLFNRADSAPTSVPATLSSPTSWNDVLQTLAEGKSVTDHPMLVRTAHSDTDVCYLTVFPQWNADHHPEALLCVWAARRHALQTLQADGTPSDDYIHSLEGVIEHRTYQQLLSAEWNELAREVLDVLPVGILLASLDGRVVYRNRAVVDTFGLRLTDYPEPNIRFFLSPDAQRTFQNAAEKGLRGQCSDKDPGGRAALIDVLPIFQQNDVQRIAVQFERPWAEVPA
jgi:PAS domain-containing protein